MSLETYAKEIGDILESEGIDKSKFAPAISQFHELGIPSVEAAQKIADSEKQQARAATNEAAILTAMGVQPVQPEIINEPVIAE